MSTIPAGNYTIDSSHSEVGFTVRHAAISKVRGRFTDFSGSIDVAQDFAQSSVKAVIQSGSVHTGNADRDGHLTSPDFWDSANNPEWTFVSTSIEGSGENFKVNGDLTINAITHPVALDVEFTGSGKGAGGELRAGFEATTTVSRKDFNLTWNAPLEGGGVLVGDKITISLELAAVRNDD